MLFGLQPLLYIDPNGWITRKVFAYWETDHRVIITSMISTIFNRLVRRFQNARSKRFVFQHIHELVALATIYGISWKDHIFNRSIYLLLNNKFRDMKFFLTDQVKKFDNNTRFVCCQALKQANWLSSRSHFCERKSTNRKGVRPKYPYLDLSRFGTFDGINPDLSIYEQYCKYIEKFSLCIDRSLLDNKYVKGQEDVNAVVDYPLKYGSQQFDAGIQLLN